MFFHNLYDLLLPKASGATDYLPNVQWRLRKHTHWLNRKQSGPGMFICRFAKLRQVDWLREGPFAEASAPGGSRNGSTEMRS